MEAISLKLDEHMLKNIDSTLKEHNYSTRTEFIRDAIREKLVELRTELLTQEFMRFHGSAKKKTSYEDNRLTRELVSKELLAHLEKRFK